ncbi:AlpA family phage regulatory protein [Stenotrophomonas sp. SMYL20]|uniref:helix-turn-helix transcriptional regulator n=1 Tax=Stenotrophomonas TaxID=40323 RepID=UPI002E77ACE7|nr:AlpA family phage regulatory protein [Stenotrophomonas sp. SMYL20]
MSDFAAPTSRAPKLIRLKEVSARTGLAKNTIYDRIRRGEFPAQIDLGGNCSAWSEDEINAWILSKMNARNVDERGLPSAA